MAGLDDAVYNFVTAIPKHRRKLAVITAVALSSIYAANKRHLLKHPLRANIPANPSERRRISRKVGVDAQFMAQLRRLLPICIPGSFRQQFYGQVWLQRNLLC